MREARLRELLRRTPLPADSDAERRGLALAEAAFAERRATHRAEPTRTSRRRLAVAPVLATVIAVMLAALALSPAGASVRAWVDDVFTTATPRPEPGLAEIPGGGRLLVESQAGPWVVEDDGSRRLLGNYDEATWSPRGLFVAVAAARELSAVEPDGTPHWTITAPGRVSDPRWSPFRYRIAYRSGRSLRVVAADGSADRLIVPSAMPVAPAWSPLGPGSLALVGDGGDLVLAATETGGLADAGPALPGIETLEWRGDPAVLLEASGRALALRRTHVSKLHDGVRFSAPQRLATPPGSEVLAAALSPDGRRVAASLFNRGGGVARSEIWLYDARTGHSRRLLAVPGRLPELAWSPNGKRLLVAWPRFDQWLFLPVRGNREGRSLSGIGRAFAPGVDAGGFPSVEGWCCSRAR